MPAETAMPLHMIHRTCGAPVEGVMRQVITRPGDDGWPQDDVIRVPYCTRCRRLVTIGEVEHDPQ